MWKQISDMIESASEKTTSKQASALATLFITICVVVTGWYVISVHSMVLDMRKEMIALNSNKIITEERLRILSEKHIDTTARVLYLERYLFGRVNPMSNPPASP